MKSNLEEKKIKIEKTTENDDDDVDNPDEIEIEDSDEDEKKDVKVKDEENYEARDLVYNMFSRRDFNGTCKVGFKDAFAQYVLYVFYSKKLQLKLIFTKMVHKLAFGTTLKSFYNSDFEVLFSVQDIVILSCIITLFYNKYQGKMTLS